MDQTAQLITDSERYQIIKSFYKITIPLYIRLASKKRRRISLIHYFSSSSEDRDNELATAESPYHQDGNVMDCITGLEVITTSNGNNKSVDTIIK